ncbi:hypothetical protein [Bdellovibrio bacteriovorus]|uniref:hypothetical protein n=1 Tax=Bdellovibrio TaxID=958 RepID=UPI0035A91BBE
MLKKALALTLALSCFGTFVHAQEREESLVMSAGDSFRRNWNVTLFSIASVSNMSYGKTASGDRAVDSYNYFGFNNKIDADTKFSVRIPFTYNTSGRNEYDDQVAATMDLQDIHFAYSKYDLGYIGDVDISGNVKIYMPTSAYSQNSKLVTKLRLEGYFEYAIGRFSSITYAVKPDIYWQRQTAYFDPETPQYNDGAFKKDPRGTTKQYSFEHYVEAVIDINRYFSVKPKVGFDEDWYYSSDVEELEGNHVTKVKAGMGLEMRPMRGLTFTLGFQNQTSLGSYKGKDVSYWQPENTEYSLMTNAYVF